MGSNSASRSASHFLCRRALALGAVAIAATIVTDDGVSTRTVLATRDMTSECCRAAALDRTHHLHLVEADMPRVSQTPSGAVVAEDIRDLQRRPGVGSKYSSGASRPHKPPFNGNSIP